MLYPAMSTLLKNVDSRYLLVNVIARRARQISIESERSPTASSPQSSRTNTSTEKIRKLQGAGKLLPTP